MEIQADSASPWYYFEADNTCSSDQRAEQEASLIFEDRHIPAQGSVPFTQSIKADNFVSQPDEGMNDTQFELSPSGGDNKSAYSTVVGFSSLTLTSKKFVRFMNLFSFHCSAQRVGSRSSFTTGIQRSSHGDYVIKYSQELYITV